MKIKSLKQISLTLVFIGTLHFLSIAQNKMQAESDTIFKPNTASFHQYKYPQWFRDAKFGIWAHWGPQAVPRQGD